MRFKSFFLSVLAVALVLSFSAQAHETGSFTAVLTGCAAPVPATATGTVSYVKDTDSGLTTLVFPSLQCASNAITASITGLPSNLYPLLDQRVPALFSSYGAVLPGQMRFLLDGTIRLYVYSVANGNVNDGNFITSGTKGLYMTGMTVHYLSVLPPPEEPPVDEDPEEP